MIEHRIDETNVPIDILRMTYNRGLILPIRILVVGHGQIGKNTWIKYFVERLEMIKKGIPLKDATWDLWDHRKYSVRTPYDYVKLYNNSNGKTINLSEAQQQMNYLDWMGVMSRVDTSTATSQGFHLNTTILDTPMATNISKHNREYIDFKIWVIKKDLKRCMAKVRPRYVKIDYNKDKFKLGWMRDWTIKYPKDFLKQARDYTDFLKEFKDKIALDNMEKTRPQHKCYGCSTKKKLVKYGKYWFCPTCYDDWIFGKELK